MIKAMRTLAVFAALALIGSLAGAARVSAQTAASTTRMQKSFLVDKAPDGPWDLYLSESIVHPGTWTGPHYHPGPEFGMTVTGEATRWDMGRMFKVRPGYGYEAPWNEIHEGANVGSEDALTLSAHFLQKGGTFQTLLPPEKAPANSPKPSGSSDLLWRNKFEVIKHPATPFTMTQRVVDFQAGTEQAYQTTELTFSNVMDGTFWVTNNGKTAQYGKGGNWVAAPGDKVTVAASNSSPGTLFVLSMPGPAK